MRVGDAEADQLGAFRVIVEREEIAKASLIAVDAQASDPLHVALYNALGAKFDCEHVASVGKATDAWILRPGKPRAAGSHPHRAVAVLIDDIRKVVERRGRQWRSS